MARQRQAGKAVLQTLTIRLEADSPWKDILEKLFSHFLLFFFPRIHERIDWSRKPQFMNTELRRAMRGSQTGKRIVDKLVKVWLLNGEEFWLLIHIEVQGQRETGFELRMYQYHCRLIDYFGEPVMTLVILTDDDPNWRPEKFTYEYPEGKYELVFPTRKLIDYESRWTELEQDPNPFAVVVMAHLRALSTRGKDLDRYKWKLRLARGLYKRRYNKTQVIDLLRFIDWIMDLPEEMERDYDAEVEKLEKEVGVTFVMGIERRAAERGRKEGERRSILQALDARFSVVPEPVRETVLSTIEEGRLHELLRRAVTCQTLDEFQTVLADARETA